MVSKSSSQALGTPEGGLMMFCTVRTVLQKLAKAGVVYAVYMLKKLVWMRLKIRGS